MAMPAAGIAEDIENTVTAYNAYEQKACRITVEPGGIITLFDKSGDCVGKIDLTQNRLHGMLGQDGPAVDPGAESNPPEH